MSDTARKSSTSFGQNMYSLVTQREKLALVCSQGWWSGEQMVLIKRRKDVDRKHSSSFCIRKVFELFGIC